jgi:hypothetical protein
MDSEFISIIKFIHDNLIVDAIKSEERHQFPNLSHFNLKNLENSSAICRNKLIMKKFYYEATPEGKRHNRTLGSEIELVGSYILTCYELKLFVPNEDDKNDEGYEYISDSFIIDKETENLINLYFNIYTTIKSCNQKKMSLLDCCEILKMTYDKISCNFDKSDKSDKPDKSLFSWLMSYVPFVNYKNKYLKYKKKYIKLKYMLKY